MKKSFWLWITAVLSLALLETQVGYGQYKGLKDYYSDYFSIGVAVSPRALSTDEATLIKREFNSMTAENAMKMGPIHPNENEYFWTHADSIVAFAQRNKLKMRGHTLCWHNQTPKWIFTDTKGDTVSKDVLLQRLKDHITTVVSHYKGKVYAWDVVNEAIDEDGTIRKTLWQQIIGDDYIDKAFEFAYEADSNAELYYNDYSLPNAAKREGTVKLIKNLQAKGIKVSAVGEQGHYTLDYPVMDSLEKSIMAFSSLGVKVMITELDITVIPFPQPEPGADISLAFKISNENNPFPTELPDSMKLVLANRYKDLFNILVKHSDCISRVTLWGVNDAQSWRNYWPIFGRTDYPLLFDRNNQPKQAYDSVIKCAEKKN